ncbi:SICAvar, type II [Plasmodium knowlesi strain H]|uniref:SICAvar, type II n=1 Tax=Plasmodium knowlesi (strain H) TaxID=5851 RepID=A0A679KUQ0_PLAKH|nr:SICAvar, type II [Plasmodium knowlesi strain H]CAA9987782.1 SICAvar, type II [Plasmodium knowlesi strain H]VVS77256.1 SICAvar, type II [Plasmodium knowlesi strain H]
MGEFKYFTEFMQKWLAKEGAAKMQAEVLLKRVREGMDSMFDNMDEKTDEEGNLCQSQKEGAHHILEDDTNRELCKILVRLFYWIGGLRQRGEGEGGNKWIWDKIQITEAAEKEVQNYLRCILGKIVIVKMLGTHCHMSKVLPIVKKGIDKTIREKKFQEEHENCEKIDFKSLSMGRNFFWKEIEKSIMNDRGGGKNIKKIIDQGKCPKGDDLSKGNIGMSEEEKQSLVELFAEARENIGDLQEIIKDRGELQEKDMDELLRKMNAAGGSGEQNIFQTIMGTLRELWKKWEDEAKKKKEEEEQKKANGSSDLDKAGAPDAEDGATESQAAKTPGVGVGPGGVVQGVSSAAINPESGDPAHTTVGVHDDKNTGGDTKTELTVELNNQNGAENSPVQVVESVDKRNSIISVPAPAIASAGGSLSTEATVQPKNTVYIQTSKSLPPAKPEEKNVFNKDINFIDPFLPYIPLIPVLITAIIIITFFLWKYFGFLIRRRRRYEDIEQITTSADPPPPEEQIIDPIEQEDLTISYMPYSYHMIRRRLPTHRKPMHKKLYKKSIIQIHLEVLDECQKGDADLMKNEFLRIIVEEYMKNEKIPSDYVPKEQTRSSGLGFRVSASEDSFPSESSNSVQYWINWIEKNKNLLEEIKREPWFHEIKSYWKEYLKEHLKMQVSDESPLRDDSDVSFLGRKKNLWKQWIAKQHDLMELNSERDWFKNLLSNLDKVLNELVVEQGNQMVQAQNSLKPKNAFPVKNGLGLKNVLGVNKRLEPKNVSGIEDDLWPENVLKVKEVFEVEHPLGVEDVLGRKNVLRRENVLESENMLEPQNILKVREVFDVEHPLGVENVLGRENVLRRENVLETENMLEPQNVLKVREVFDVEHPLGVEDALGRKNVLRRENVLETENMLEPQNVLKVREVFDVEHPLGVEDVLGRKNMLQRENVLESENMLEPQNVLKVREVFDVEHPLGVEDVLGRKNVLRRENVLETENMLEPQNVLKVREVLEPEKMLEPRNVLKVREVLEPEKMLAPEKVLKVKEVFEVEKATENTPSSKVDVVKNPELHQQSYRKKQSIAKLWMLILALVIEQCEVEDNLHGKEIYLDNLLRNP